MLRLLLQKQHTTFLRSQIPGLFIVLFVLILIVEIAPNLGEYNVPVCVDHWSGGKMGHFNIWEENGAF